MKGQIRLILFTVFLIACNNNRKKEPVTTEMPTPQKNTVHSKPPASFNDTLVIAQKAAVFFFPDSVQLKKIEELTQKAMFESMMHEYEFQIRNCKIVLNKNWPGIIIIEAKNIRYLLMKRVKSKDIIIDLNNRDDSHGLFLFDGIKEPHYADMMNIDTELPRYFSN